MSSKLQFGVPDTGTVRSALLLVAVLAMVATAGCTGFLGGDDQHGDPVDSVPEGQDMLLHVDMAVMEDETTATIGDELAQSETSQEDFQDALDQFENETGLDPRGVSEVLMYGNSSQISDPTAPTSQEEFGFVVHSSWSEDELVSSINEEEDGELQQTSYQGEDVLYEPTGAMAEDQDALYLGVLGDGAYVLGTENAVKGSLDVEYGDASSLSGPLRDTYDDSRDGYVTFAMVMPEQSSGMAGGGMGGGVAENLETVSAVYYTEGSDVGVEARISTTDSQTANDLQGAVSLMLSQYGSQDSPYSDLLNQVEVEADGSAILITFQQDAQELASTLQELADQQSQTTL